MNLKKYAKLLMNISKEIPIYWPITTETLLKSLCAKYAIKTNISSKLVAINAVTATSTIKKISI